MRNRLVAGQAIVSHVGDISGRYFRRMGAVSQDLLTCLHTFIGGFFPAFGGSIKNLEILSQNGEISVGFAAGNLSYDFRIRENAALQLCCGWGVSLGDPDWPQKVLGRLKGCITHVQVQKKRIPLWNCSGCEYDNG
jgi:hypothetical protein